MSIPATEHHLVVRKTARYCLLGELGPSTTDVWIVCHGFGQLARDFIAGFASIVTPQRAVIAPEALSRFYRSQGTVHTPDTPVGATWMTTEDRETEIADYVGYLDMLLLQVVPPAAREAGITLLGFSQGAATVSRWVARSAPPLKRVVLWGGLLPPEYTDGAPLGGLSRQPLHFVCGNGDRYFRPELIKSEFQRLKRLGIPVILSEFNGGHSIDEPTLTSLANS